MPPYIVIYNGKILSNWLGNPEMDDRGEDFININNNLINHAERLNERTS